MGLFCLFADPMDIRKLVCIQNEIKRKKELYKLRPASSATITFVVRKKLTFTHPLWFNKKLNNSKRNPV